MAKEETKKPELEREYIIPLREKCRSVPRYKKTNKAVKTIKEFLARHMKVTDRNLDNVRISPYLNQFLWHRGIRHPPHKVKIHAIKEGDIVRVELSDMPKGLSMKKAREEKIEKKGMEMASKKKPKAEEKKEEKAPEEKKSEEKAIEEKKVSTIEAGKQMEKAEHKMAKHAAKKQERLATAQKRSLAY